MGGKKKQEPLSGKKQEHAASPANPSGGNPPGIQGLEQHGRNANHYEKVLQWRHVIEDHPLFTNISQEMPLSIKDFGLQHPFNDQDFSVAMSRDGGDTGYTAGINLFWCDAMFTPTPGIPVRTETIPDLMECYFKLPATMPHNIIISLKEGEHPLEKRGALCAISPEEVRHAMMAAIARDIECGVGSEVLEEWRRRVLSCTATFQLHATEAGRLQVAMQLRENMANDHEAMSRSQLQRVYEIIFFRDTFARTHGRDQATAANIAAEYAKVRMAKGREKISKSFVDTALTIHGRLLQIPDAERMLLEMDSNLAKDDNPFNSVHRLQAIVSKCGNSKENAMWVLRHMAHMVTNLSVSASSSDFSVDGLRGNARTGNRGLIDTILLKKEAIGYLCHKLPVQLGIEGDATWLSDLRVSLADHNSHLASRKGDGLAWRNRLTPAQVRYVAFAEDLLYGVRHDQPLKNLIRAGKTVAAIDTFPGLSEALDDVKSLLATEQHENSKSETILEDNTPAPPEMSGVVLKIVPAESGDKKDKKEPKAEEIKFGDLDEAQQAEWLRSREFLKQQINNFVHLIVLDEVADLTKEIVNTPAGKYEGGGKVGGRTRFVGIVWDSRVNGECSSRPSVRMPALQVPEIGRLFDCIRARHDRTAAPPDTRSLHPFDIYISLAGGRDLGSSYQRLFQNLGPPAPVTRLIHVVLDPVSVQDRFRRVCGIASNKTHDTMRLTAAPWPKKDLKSTPRLNYRGTSASDSIGHVELGKQGDDETWVLTWGQKKSLYGARGLILAGGRGDVIDDEVDDEDQTAADPPQRRTDDTEELAFYHALPSQFWEEVVHDYQLGAILDVAAGDGCLALTAVRHRLPYTGIVFTTHHRDLILARLLDILSAGALKAGDKWYDPSLVKTLVAAAKKKNDQEETGQEPAKKKAKHDKGKKCSDGEGADSNTAAKTKKEKKPKAKAKAGKKTKKTKAKKESESNSDGSDVLESEGSSDEWE